MLRRIFRIVTTLLLVLVLVLGCAAYWIFEQVRGSLPEYNGRVVVSGIDQPVVVERDGLAIPTVRAGSLCDLAFAMGYVHGQDRLFQMDLLRRNSAGELAELVGAAAAGRDKEVRVFRFREQAKKVLERSTPEERRAAESYARGVNAARANLAKPPFEYLLLGQEPAPWKPEDSVLVTYSMFLDLQGNDHKSESTIGLIHDVLPKPLAEFLTPKGTEWDAPIDGGKVPIPPIPGPEVFDLRKEKPERRAAYRLGSPGSEDDAAGSNNWAVAGAHSTHGGALLADDMHLKIRVPNIWFRATMMWPAKDGGVLQMTGPTLPGTPTAVVGSNTRIAWGFTNSEGDWNDLVVLDVDPADANRYKTPEGYKQFERFKETIKVKGELDVELDVAWTIWGPVIDKDHKGRPRAWRWIALEPGGVNFGMSHMPEVRSLEDALELAARCGMPNQNFVVADDKGRIAWTIAGRIPKRVGFEGRTPTSWADGKHRWDGFLDPKDYPKVVQPKAGRIWTANARVVSGEMLEKVGFGGYDTGARQGQIRDDLLAIEKASEADMLAVQLDDRALFWDRWQKLLAKTLASEKAAAHPANKEYRALVEKWGGRASVDSAGFRLVQLFREKTRDLVFVPLLAPCKKADPRMEYLKVRTYEGPLWRLVNEKPMHLLDPTFASWDDLLLAAADATREQATSEAGALADYTWGRANTTKIQHPLSLAIRQLSEFLDMKREELPGAWSHMPRIQRPDSGASQRMAVSPGREKEGYFHMPCGQSGHPLSRHYKDGHDAWAYGRPTSFLPGMAVYKMMLLPGI